MNYNYNKVILYKINNITSTVERIVLTDHAENWKIIYDKIGEQNSNKVINGSKFNKNDIIETYKKAGFELFKLLNPAGTIWEEYYFNNDQDLKEYMLKWERRKTIKKKRILKKA